MAKFIRLPLFHRSIRVVYLLVLSLILVGSIGAYAASVTIVGSTNAGYQGEYVVDNGYFTASAISYNVVEAAQSASSAGLAWSNGGTAYVNALVAGDWEVAWTLTILTGATASHVYTITVTSTAASGVTSTLYTFTFTSPASISNGQTMTILWDTSAVTWSAPAAIQITVA
ncbi:MAG: hypothetical protein OK441_03935 [Thaumarchaeota archaeon]|nr:hypothetical protein [Nitrososphaerota archaeon]